MCVVRGLDLWAVSRMSVLYVVRSVDLWTCRPGDTWAVDKMSIIYFVGGVLRL